MTDRELLELAAKAAGLADGSWFDGWNDEGRETGDYWNPLTLSGDAFELALKLGLIVECGRAWISRHGPMFGEDVLPDPYAATRRAIVRAAAEIGRNKT
jgi:hypothetical protein